MQLNSAQMAAVEHDTGPLLVIAGAGTGKTRVITSRIIHLIESKKAAPEEILALTFTDKAAGEMRARVDEQLPLGYQELQISTFHAFGQRLLQENGLEIGLSPDFTLLTKATQWLLLKQNLFRLPLAYYRPLGNPLKFIEALLTHIERAKQEMISPEMYQSQVLKDITAAGYGLADMEFVSISKGIPAELEALQKQWEIAQLYAAYQRLLVEDPAQTRLDFGDLIYLSVQLLESRASVCERLQAQFRYILIDEFQDTNYSQNALVKLLLGQEQNVMVVGDDDQSIYRFRGASVSNILEFQKDFPAARTIVLTENYRSTQAILDVSYRVIQNNNPDRLEVKAGIDKRLLSDRPGGAPPLLLRGATAEDEAELVADQIEAIRAAGGLAWSDFAILARANAHLETFVQTLRYRGIPFTVGGSRGLYSRPEIKDLLAFLYVLVNPDNSPQLFRLLSIEQLEISPLAVLLVFQTAHRTNVTLWEMLHNAPSITELKQSDLKAIARLVELIEQYRPQAAYGNPGEILLSFLKEIGYTKALLEQDTLESANKILNIRKLFDLMKQFLRLEENATVLGYVHYVEIMIEAGEDPATAEMDSESDAVRLMTIHAAKGLEFDTVFLTNLVTQRFPTRRMNELLPLPDVFIKETLPEGDEHIEEERRLFYVGMTRAKRNLFLTYADDYGGVRARKPSPFVLEALSADSLVDSAVRVAVEATPAAGQHVLAKPFDVQAHLPSQFSYSQLQTFKACPLRYKYTHIYRVPVQLEGSLVFGQAIHNTLKAFYDSLLDQTPTLEGLLDLFRSHWKREGFSSGEEVDAQYERGKKVLSRFWMDNQSSFTPVYATEMPFHWRFGENILKGVIDRIDRLPDGSYEIIDYKTGAIADQATLDKRVGNDEQLSVYALAARDVLQLDVSRYTLYFLESGLRSSASRSAAQLEKVSAEIEATTAEIKQSDFAPTPSSFTCKHCPYQSICPFAAR